MGFQCNFSTISLDNLFLTSSSVRLEGLDMNNIHSSLRWHTGKVHWSFSSTSEQNKWCPLYYTGNKPHSCGSLHSLFPSQKRYKGTWRWYPWKHCHNIRQDHLFYLWFFWSCLDFLLLVGCSDIFGNVVCFFFFRNKYLEAYKCITLCKRVRIFNMLHIKSNLRFHSIHT